MEWGKAKCRDAGRDLARTLNEHEWKVGLCERLLNKSKQTLVFALLSAPTCRYLGAEWSVTLLLLCF